MTRIRDGVKASFLNDGAEAWTVVGSVGLERVH